jgi:hypothetical protein
MNVRNVFLSHIEMNVRNVFLSHIEMNVRNVFLSHIEMNVRKVFHCAWHEYQEKVPQRMKMNVRNMAHHKSR